MVKERIARTLVLMVLLLAIAPIHPAAAQGPSPARVAVILIVDNSNSMADSDATGLRFTAARMFVSLLDEGDAAGLIRFSTESRPLTDGLVTLDSTADKRSLAGRLEPVDAGGWTDVKAALADAQAMVRGTHLADHRIVVVLLTDGRPEIAQSYPGYEEEALGRARNLGVPVLAVALTPAAQTPFLNRLAADTGGRVIPAHDASDLLDACLEVLGQVKDRTVIGAGRRAAPGWAPLDLDPALAPYVERASFVISKPEAVTAQLIGPDGGEVRRGDPGVSFSLTDTPRFAAVTVEQPAGGAWGFRLQGKGTVQARAILRSRLRVELVAPGRFHEAERPMSIVVHLIEERPDGRRVKLIGEAHFSALITRPDGGQDSLDGLYDDGTHGDAVAGDGEYTRLYVDADRPGAYTIAIRGWKGMVPVKHTARVEVVPFPEIVIDAPLDDGYDIQGEPLPLRVHLEGGMPPLLDRGEIIARIEAPSGDTQEVALEGENGGYAGAFLPVEEGMHEVEFVPRGATYKGLPYEHTAEIRFEARITPAIVIGVERLDLGRVEMVDAQQGMTVTIPASSTSRGAEALHARLEMPGFVLAEGTSLSVPAGGERELAFRLRASSQVPPGSAKGKLVLTARQGVNLENGTVPIQAELFQPTLRVEPNPLNLGSLVGCFDRRGRLTMTIRSTSMRPERVHLGVEGVEGLELSPATVEVAPGTSEVGLAFTPTERLSAGEHRARLSLQGREGLRIEPEPKMSVHLRVRPVWARCRWPIGGLLLGLALIGIVTVRGIRDAIRPPAVTGTLYCWPKGGDQASADFHDLTAMSRAEVAIGRSESCDLTVPDSSLADEHAVLRAEEVVDRVRVMLVPVSRVQIGYRSITEATPLRHKDVFTMGEWKFKYSSDEEE